MQRAIAVLTEDTIFVTHTDNVTQARHGVDSFQAFKITAKNHN